MGDEAKANFDKFTQKVRDVTDTVGKKANDLVEEGKLLIKIRDAEKEIEKLFYALGLQVYDSVESGKGVCETDEQIRLIDEKKADLISLRAALAELKGQKFCTNCSTANKTDSNFCNKCGKAFD